ncbi:hypothetical protein CEXT_106751 [Caerostris extrusa]|uniref:Uncharacterized protein n=1 Tax=Caerostris extrusa TaxID=172846 RepID=A0AAV4NSU8_CAEEX|nr:hypothetical protein CEXT_106751 [Caerostris extrusa]
MRFNPIFSAKAKQAEKKTAYKTSFILKISTKQKVINTDILPKRHFTLFPAIFLLLYSFHHPSLQCESTETGRTASRGGRPINEDLLGRDRGTPLLFSALRMHLCGRNWGSY